LPENPSAIILLSSDKDTQQLASSPDQVGIPHVDSAILYVYCKGSNLPLLLTTVKSGSTPVGGLVRSGQKRTKGEGRGLDKRLVRPELATVWIQQLRAMSVDPLCRFRSRRGDGNRDGDGQGQE